MKLRTFFYTFCVFTVLSLLIAIQLSVFDNLTGKEFHFKRDISFLLIDFYLWLLFVPLIDWAVQHFSFRSSHVFRDIAINVSLAFSVVIVKTFLDTCLFGFVLRGVFPPPPENPFPQDSSFLELFYYMLLSPKSIILFLVFWAIFAVFYSFHNSRKLREQEIASSQLESQLAKAQLLALQMQIQPHFLFNTLNSISSLLRENPEAADEMIAKLSDMLRYSLTNIDVHEVRLGEEIEFLKGYLDIEKIRFQERLEVVFDINRRVINARVPRMLLQPLVENSIRHGISKKAKPGIVTIQAHPLNGNLEIVIQDTGPGIALKDGQPEREGIGLKTTRQRLNQHFGSNYRLEFLHPFHQGTLVKLSIPIMED